MKAETFFFYKILIGPTTRYVTVGSKWKASFLFSIVLIFQIIDGFSEHPNQYNSIKITRLLRFLRNVDEHKEDPRIPRNVRQLVAEPAPYFLQRGRFATLPMLVHRILRDQAKHVAQGGGNGEVWINRSKLSHFFLNET